MSIDQSGGSAIPPGSGQSPSSSTGNQPSTINKPTPATSSSFMEKMGIPQSAVNQLKNGEMVEGSKGLLKGQWDAGQHYANKLGEKTATMVPGKGIAAAFAKSSLKVGAKFLPGVGSAIAAAAAIDDFRHGDYIGGAFNVVGAIPGPVGWVGLGASFAWNLFHHGGGYGLWDAPDGSATFMLPGAAKDVANVKEADAALADAQRGVFAFDDGPQGTVWNETPPTALRVDTPEVQAAVTRWLKGIADQFAQIDQAMQNSGEPYLLKYRARLQPHFAAMEKLPGHAKEITAQLTAASDGAGDAYRAVIGANHAARTQLASDGALTDQGPATTMKTKLERATSEIGGANEKLANLFAHAAPAVLASGIGSPGGHKKPEHRKPAMPAAPTMPTTPTAPAATTPVAPKVAPAEPMPNFGRGGSLGGGSPMGGGMPHGGSPMGGTPLGGNQNARPLGGGHKLGEDHDKRDDKAAEKKPLLPGSDTDNRKATPQPVSKSGEHAPEANKPQAKTTPKPAAKTPEAAKEVDVKGHKTAFPDAKTAKMAQLLAGADPNHPVSLADAAAQAGLTPPVPGQDPGQQVSPADSKAGDLLVTGDKPFLMLGDGQFYDLDAYKVVGADALPSDMGDRAGYFHLNDAAAGAQPPVSGQTPGGVPFDVPGGRPAPSEPADASAAAPPAGVTSAGTPGVPAPGKGGGPSSAAATDTGIGESVPSAGVTNLDPGAVK